MLSQKIGYSYNDVTIVPEVISDIKSRSECNPYVDYKLPIFASPMASVVSEENYKIFEANKIIPILPRIQEYDINYRIKKMHQGWWVAVSLKELENDIINDLQTTSELNNKDYRICVDIANGHMKYLYAECALAKTLARKRGINLTIMTGNIANAKTYEWIYKNALCEVEENGHKYYDCAIDYIRVGIGGGSGCFIDGTKIKTINGEKNIEDINIGDKVLTIDNTYQDVINKTRFKSNELIKINNEITSTINHKFFVINKSDKDKVNEQNLEKYGYWIEANKLNKNKHLLIKYE